MSIATLLLNDSSRTGVQLELCLSKRSHDGAYLHPFMWHDAYQRLSETALPTAVEEAVVSTAQIVGDALAWCVGTNLQAVMEPLVRQVEALSAALRSISSAKEEDFSKQAKTQVSQARVVALYNIGITRLNLALRNATVDADLRVTEELGHIAAFFEEIASLHGNDDSIGEAIHATPANLRMCALLAAATATEINVAYWSKEASSQLDRLCAAAHKCCTLYRNIVVRCDRDATSIVDAEQVSNFANIKRLVYEGVALFALSLQPGCTKGESRRRRACAAFDIALEWTLETMAGARKQVEDELQFWTQQCNNFVKLQKRGGIVFGFVSSQRRRYLERDSIAGADPVVETTPEDALLVEQGRRPDPVVAAVVPAPKVLVTATTQHRNLIMSAMGKAASSRPFQFIEAVVSLSSAHVNPSNWQRSKVAIALIIDICTSDARLANQQKEVIMLAVKSGLLQAGDEVSLVSHDLSQPGTAPAPKLTSFTLGSDAVIDQLTAALAALKPAGRFVGSRGTSLLPLIAAAQEHLGAAAYSSHHSFVAVVSDAADRTAASSDADVASFLAARNGLQWKSTVPLHAFHIGSLGQGALLTAACKHTRGNYACFFPECGDDAASVAALRAWFVGLVTNACLTTMRSATLRIDATGEAVIHSAGISSAKAPKLDDAPCRDTTVTVQIPDMSAGHGSRVCVTFAMPSDACSADVIGLATATLNYTDEFGARKETSLVLTNVSCPELVDREMYPWLRQLRLTNAKGAVLISRSTEQAPRNCRGGEALYALDSISTVSGDLDVLPHGAASLTAPEGLMIEILEETKLNISEIDTNCVGVDLQSGEIAMSTASFGRGKVSVADQYTLVVAPSSIVRVSTNSSVLSILVIMGSAVLELRGAPAKSLPDGTTGVPLQAPKQTFARLGDAPAAPWALAEDGLKGFTALSRRFADYLTNVAFLDVERIRGQVTDCLEQLTRRIARRNRVGTLVKSTAARRCRKFIAMHRVNEAKQALANSTAYAVGHDEIDGLKRLLDIAVNLGSPLADHKRTWAAMVLVMDAWLSTRDRRPRGCSTAFASQSHLDNITALLSARDKAAAEREAAAAAKLREAADAERKRRQMAIAAVFPVWDFSRRNVVSTAELQSVLYALPNRRHPSVARCIGEWERLLELIDIRKYRQRDATSLPPVQCFNVDQLVAVICHISEHLDPADFNALADGIRDTVKETATAIEATRLDRSLYSTFQRLDTHGLGYLQWSNRVVATLRYTFGDELPAFQRLEAATLEAVKVLNRITPSEASRPASKAEEHYTVNETAPLAMQAAPAFTVDTIDTEKITPLVYVTAMRGYFAGFPEAQANRDLALLCDHARHYTKLRGDTAAVMLKSRKESERQHIVEWDLPHVFDGVSDREIRDLIDPRWKQPDVIQNIAAPLCILIGLVPLPTVDEPTTYVKASNYWASLRNVLKHDARTFFGFLLSFPPLSISHRQAQLVGAALREKTFESAQLLRYSPVLAALCSWAKLILRVAFLEHEWDDIPFVQQEVATAIQAQRFPNLHAIREVPSEALPPPEERTVVVKKSAPTYSRQFQPVYTRPAANATEFCTSSAFEAAVVSPRRPPSALSSSPAALRRPMSAASYGTIKAPETPTRTPQRPMTARPPSVVRPASATKRSNYAATAWHENDWEVPTGLNAEAY